MLRRHGGWLVLIAGLAAVFVLAIATAPSASRPGLVDYGFDRAQQEHNDGDFASALQHLSKCTPDQPPSDALAACLNLKGELLFAIGRCNDARAHLDRALALGERLHAGDERGHSLELLAEWDMLCGNPADAVTHGRSALGALETSSSRLGKIHRAAAQMMLGRAFRELHQLEEAEKWARQSLASFEGLEGPSGENVAAAAADLGEVLKKKGDYAEAASLYRRSMRIYHPEGPDAGGNPRYDIVLSDLASVESASGYGSLAREHGAEAVSLLERDFGPGSVYLAAALEGLGRDEAKAGEVEPAFGHLRRARDIYKISAPASDLSNLDNLIARAYWDQGRFAEALPFAREGLCQPPACTAHDAEMAELTLAMVLTKLKKYDEAASYYQKAVDRAVAAFGPNSSDAAHARQRQQEGQAERAGASASQAE